MLFALRMFKNLLQTTFCCIFLLIWAYIRYIEVLIINIKDVCSMSDKAGQIKDLEKQWHHILSHDRGIEGKLDSWVRDKLGDEVVKLWSVIMMMHFYLAVIL